MRYDSALASKMGKKKIRHIIFDRTNFRPRAELGNLFLLVLLGKNWRQEK